MQVEEKKSFRLVVKRDVPFPSISLKIYTV